jgi:hypothetical protein
MHETPQLGVVDLKEFPDACRLGNQCEPIGIHFKDGIR